MPEANTSLNGSLQQSAQNVQPTTQSAPNMQQSAPNMQQMPDPMPQQRQASLGAPKSTQEPQPSTPEPRPDTPLTEAFKIIREQQQQLQDQQRTYQEQISQLLRSGASINDGSAAPQSQQNVNPVQVQVPRVTMPGESAPEPEPYVSLADLGKEIGKRPRK